MQSKITPIICAQTFEEIPINIKNYDPTNYFVMYEPFSAISTQGNYHPESPDTVTTTLKDWQNKLPNEVRFLYGGSVSPENISSFQSLLLSNSLTHLSGFVVGHASLDAKSFSEIITLLCGLPN